MLTVKLYTDGKVTVVEGTKINVYAAGPNEGIADNPKDRLWDVIEISVEQGEKNKVFYLSSIKRPRPKGWAAEVDFYEKAYIENEHGATIEIVKPV